MKPLYLDLRWPRYVSDPIPLYAEITTQRGLGFSSSLRMVRCIIRNGKSGRQQRIELWLWPYDCVDLIREDLIKHFGFRPDRVKLL